ncbi:aldose 1-epimerase [Salinimicrobium marinum]|uniref:Aldose 1-epimerase n=2 Tax=Salinimicrobium marinum TaxID=680283 RepID=A0A918SJB9_9FLAO|nr:aldose 1-epimerase [Salinimicrobium marinum]
MVKNNDQIEEKLKSTDFDTIIDDKQVNLYWIKSDSIKAAFTNYGGRLVGLWVPDRNGNLIDVVVGMGSVEGFVNSTEPYFGATIGRVGNRIAKGKFKIQDEEFNIPLNNGENSLHGGTKGFQDVVWNAEKVGDKKVIFRYRSPDGEEGFPGNLDVQVTYSVTDDRSLIMQYTAETDKMTPVNLTNHAFFNLNGEGSGRILDHKVKIYADEFTPVDSGLIPTGNFFNVEGTPFDFRQFHTIGERIEQDNEQLEYGKGYDHNFVLNQTKVGDMNHAATVIGDDSGVKMDVFTQEPGIQFYSGNFMEGKNEFKSGATDEFRTAFALETQHFPDAPNQPDFPSIMLSAGEQYSTESVYQFSLEGKPNL